LQAAAAVETRGLTKRYGREILAVDSLDLTVNAGEVYGFLGPNGAGKTTTLRMLLGLIRPTAGAATVVGQQPGKPAGLAGIGALVEAPAFYPYLSARQNLRVLADMTGTAYTRVDEVLEVVELTERARDKFTTYSMGMKQRVGVAAALLKDPNLLILDEPTNGLDPQGMVDMRNLIRDIAKGGKTVLLSSHLLGEVEHICTRIGVIQGGRLVAEGTVPEIRALGGGGRLLVKASPIDRATGLLTELLGPDQVRAADGILRLKVGPERAAEINRRLVTAGVDVAELRMEERSLEDVFLQLTGDKQGF
jgi:ABC-2 type transport system ATP-binding protein